MPTKNKNFSALKVVLPSLKIDLEIEQLISRAMNRIAAESKQIPLTDFRRSALTFFCQRVLERSLRLKQVGLIWEELNIKEKKNGRRRNQNL